ncbi:AAA family ATPase [Streptomyces sp. NPDC048639]|uniref:helix-turn-helix transcriptional regulator n=1 Tax=Streptomyces sp. NPDC048639 TaxID=3365581 RepID=UPI003720FB21
MEDQEVSPFIGRTRELARMTAASEGARSQGIRIVFVSGPAGAGKSALTEQFLSSLSGASKVVLHGMPGEKSFPFAAVHRLLASFDSMERRGNLSSLDELREMSVMEIGGKLIKSLDSGVKSTSAPTVLVIEDAELLDTDSLHVLGFTFLRLWADPILVVVNTENASSTRQGMGLTPRSDRFTEISLGGFTRAESEEFIKTHGADVPSKSRMANLMDWTGGNPLYLRAVLGARSGSHVPEDPSLIEIPRTLADAVGQWTLAFPPTGRRALQYLAVLDSPATIPFLRALIDSDRLTEEVEPLIDSGAAEWDNVAGVPRLKLVHRGQRDALYSAIPPSERRRMHRRIAEFLEPPAKWRHSIAAADAYDADLADTLRTASAAELKGGNLPLAAELSLGVAEMDPDSQGRPAALLNAVRLLVISGQYNRALYYRGDVVDTPASPFKDEVLGLLFFAEGMDATACHHFQLAVDGYAADGSQADAAYAAASLAGVQASLGLGEACYSSASFALAHHPRSLVSGTAKAAAAHARALMDGAPAGLEELAGLPENPVEVENIDIEALTHRGFLRGLSGRLSEAVSDLSVVTRRRPVGATRGNVAVAHVQKTWCLILLGEWNDARREVSLAFDVARTCGRPVEFSSLHCLSAFLHAAQGHWDAASADLAESQHSTRVFDFSGPEFHRIMTTAFIEYTRGNQQRVAQLIKKADGEPTNATRSGLYAVWYLPFLGSACAAIGDIGSAEEALSRLSNSGSTGALHPVAAHWVHGEILAAQGDVEGAVQQFRSGLAHPPDGGDPAFHRALIGLALGRVLMRSGRTDEGGDRLRDTARIFTALEALPYVQMCLDLLKDPELSAAAGRAVRFWDHLTNREQDVARLVGHGWTNREIADELYVSAKTVEYHLGNIYAKSGIANRRALRDLVQSL